MICYRANCNEHSWVGSLHNERGLAVSDAVDHIRNTGNAHSVIIEEVYIPDDTFKVNQRFELTNNDIVNHFMSF